MAKKCYIERSVCSYNIETRLPKMNDLYLWHYTFFVIKIKYQNISTRGGKLSTKIFVIYMYEEESKFEVILRNL